MQTAAGTSTSATVCQACPTGQYCAGGAATPVACGANEWDNDADSATACVGRTNCVAGQYASNDGSATTDRVCTGCTTGYTTAATANSATCTAWTSCAPGTYVSTAGTATADRACTGCTTGYTATANEGTCAPWTDCANPNQYQTAAPTASSNRTCGTCAANTFTSQPNALACAAPPAAVAFTSANNLDGDSNDSVGFRFVVGAANITVTSLGVWDENGDGLAISHPVGLYLESTQALVTAATLPAGTTATLDNGFRYVDITPVTLSANTAYRIASYRTNGSDRVTIGVTGQTSAAGVTIGNCHYVNGAGGLVFPLNDYGIQGVHGPNFRFY